MKRLLPLTIALLLLAGHSGIAQKSSERSSRPAVRVEFRIAEDRQLPGLKETTVKGSDERIYLHRQVVLSNAQIASAVVERDSMAGPVVLITFNATGKSSLQRITSRNISKRLAIVVDGVVVSAPRIVDPIAGGKAMLSGNFTQEEAERIAEALSRKK